MAKSKLDLKAAAAHGATVFDTIATGTMPTAPQEISPDGDIKVIAEREEQKVQEVQARQEELRTQGKKGAKLQRINMAFTPSNLEYIRTMSKLKGQTYTQFINDIIAKQREADADIYEKAKSIIDQL